MGLNLHARGWKEEPETPVASGCEGMAQAFDSRGHWSAELQLWQEIERFREIDWQRHPAMTSARLQRRAILAARSLPVLPSRKVLEVGAGSGVWTAHLASVLGGQNPLTAVTFNSDLAREAQARMLPGTRFIHLKDFQSALFVESFDYVVASDIATRDLCSAVLEIAYRCLKPGGQFIFFAQNASNSAVYIQKVLRRFSPHSASVGFQRDVTIQGWNAGAACQGFGDSEIAFIEVLSAPESSAGEAIELILERSPIARCLASTVCFRGSKPGTLCAEVAPNISFSTYRQLFGAVSVVVPCHNEEANVERMVKTLLGMYGDYIHEIVIVDDNSTDGTAAVGSALASAEPRVKLIKRNPPSGVGRALRDGYAAATGKYILSIDCDFVAIASEFKGLFEAVAEGYDGAIGSRFSPESALVRYPFFKILCNRGYHLVLNLLLGKRVRDVSNNLKLYRAEILKNLEIEENHFAANVETGLKPLLKNYRIREVPASWINRSPDMGSSSFNLLKVGPAYLGVLLRTTWRFWRGRYDTSG